ncbi:MAG: DUF1614 domain-containing protein [Candidatus Syntropharchaeia archaeon]
MRRAINKPDIRSFVFFGFLDVLIFILGCVRRGYFTPEFSVGIVVLVLVLNTIEIPIYSFRTKKPSYTEREMAFLGKKYGVSVKEELRIGKGKAYDSKVTLNLGGFIIPVLFSIFLLKDTPLMECGMITLIMIVITHMLSKIENGIGIVVPDYIGFVCVPLAIILAPEYISSCIFVSGIAGILIGEITTLLTIKEDQGSAFFSLGGAGNFNAIYILILLSVLISFL